MSYPRAPATEGEDIAQHQITVSTNITVDALLITLGLYGQHFTCCRRRRVLHKCSMVSDRDMNAADARVLLAPGERRGSKDRRLHGTAVRAASGMRSSSS